MGLLLPSMKSNLSCFFPPVLPLLFLSAQGKRTIEGKGASHGNMKRFTTEKRCNSLWSCSRFCTLALALTWSRGLPQAICAASWSSLVKIQTFQRWKRSHESGHRNVCCLTAPTAHDWCWLEGPDFKHPSIPSSEEMGKSFLSSGKCKPEIDKNAMDRQEKTSTSRETFFAFLNGLLFPCFLVVLVFWGRVGVVSIISKTVSRYLFQSRCRLGEVYSKH